MASKRILENCWSRPSCCRPASIPSISSSSPSTSILRHASTSSRPSADSETAIRSLKGKGRSPSKRVMPIRKQYLIEQYKNLLTSSSVVVFLRPEDFTVAELTKLRVDLATIPLPSNPSADAINAASASQALSTSSQTRPTFTYFRAGLLGPTIATLAKSHPELQTSSRSVVEYIKSHGGSLGVLSLPTLHPPTLKAAMAAITKLSNSTNQRKKMKEAAAAAAGKGKATQQQEAKTQRMGVISALVDHRAANQVELTHIANLPPLDQIYAELLAVIESPARSVFGVLQSAAGGELARTLEGFRIGLEEQQQQASSPTGGTETAPAAV